MRLSNEFYVVKWDKKIPSTLGEHFSIILLMDYHRGSHGLSDSEYQSSGVYAFNPLSKRSSKLPVLAASR